MMKRLLSLIALASAVSLAALAQQSDLSGLIFVIDPGHGGNNPANDRHVVPDPGTDFWESESNFQKALLLRPMLQSLGATVYLTRETNYYPGDNEPSLSARVDFANSVEADWFHSIHSNATGWTVNTTVNRTLMLVREQIVAGGDSVYGPGTGSALWPQAWSVSATMGQQIVSLLRTQSWSRWLDYSFYGTYTLGVLRGLYMPGQLSEGSFHDFHPETRRLMNNSYRKMEAYALRNSFMQFFGVPSDTLGIIAGIQSRRGFSTLIDTSTVRLLPENRVYRGDNYRNGFYLFDSLAAGTYWIVFETPGYFPDTVQITLAPGAVTFLDRGLEPTAPPTILTSAPAAGDTAFKANLDLTFQFSKVMDTASVRAAFSIAPPVNGRLQWSASNTFLSFMPDSVVLPFDQEFTITIDTTARSERGMYLDGNGDGLSGDAFAVTFRTEPVDAWPPVIVHRSPAPGDTVGAPNHVINVTFDELLNPATVTASNFAIRIVGGLILSKTLEYWESGERSGVNLYVPGGLMSGKTYRLSVSGVSDRSGNAIPTAAPVVWDFSVGPQSYIYTTIDDFNADPTANWWQPTTSGSTTGVSGASLAGDASKKYSFVSTSTASAKLTYAWNTTAGSWLIREYLNAGTPRSVTWTRRLTRLQTYVWGDGSGTLFRFAVDDSVDVFPGGSGTNHEVSAWVPIDWVGWRLVEWDLENDPVGSWLGNGVLEGRLRFDSFQLQYRPDTSAAGGAINFDLLQLAVDAVTSVEPVAGIVPGEFRLHQNYPNPFNPETRIVFDIAETGDVRLEVIDILGRTVRTLTAELTTPGRYTVAWNGRDDNGGAVPSGIYFSRLIQGHQQQIRKMMLIK